MKSEHCNDERNNDAERKAVHENAVDWWAQCVQDLQYLSGSVEHDRSEGPDRRTETDRLNIAHPVTSFKAAKGRLPDALSPALIGRFEPS